MAERPSRCFAGGAGRSTRPRGATSSPTCSSPDGSIDAVGGGLDAEGAEVIDCRGARARARARGPAHPSARAGLRAQGDDRDRHAGRRGGRVTRRSRRWPTPNPSPTTRAIVAEVRDKAAAAGLVRRLPGRRDHEGPRGRVDRRARRDGRGRRPGVQRRRQLRADGAGAAQRPRSTRRRSRRGRDRRSLRGPVARRGRADARGRAARTRSGLAGRPAEAEEIVVARDLAIARATGGRLHICPPLVGAVRSS